MVRRLVQYLRGIGILYAGGQVLRTVPYELSLWSEDPEPTAEAVATVTAIDGQLDLAGIGEAVVLAGPAWLTLELEDGRRLAVKLTNRAGGFESKGWVSELPLPE
jgi:hypothetical protein